MNQFLLIDFAVLYLDLKLHWSQSSSVFPWADFLWSFSAVITLHWNYNGRNAVLYFYNQTSCGKAVLSCYSIWNCTGHNDVLYFPEKISYDHSVMSCTCIEITPVTMKLCIFMSRLRVINQWCPALLIKITLFLVGSFDVVPPLHFQTLEMYVKLSILFVFANYTKAEK